MLATEILRIHENIEILLRKGVFPGEMSPAIAETLAYNANIISKIKANQENGNGNRDEADASGLAGSGVPDQGRKSGKRGKKRARSESTGA